MVKRWSRSLRLMLERDGESVRLISVQPVNMVPPPPPVTPEPHHVGFWAELRSESGEAVYHHLLTHQMVPGAEVFSPTSERSVRRVPLPRGPQVFTVVVPDTEEARSLVIVGPPDAGAGKRELRASRREIARFDLSPKGGR